MMYGGHDHRQKHRHHHHHAKQYQTWDSSKGYPVHATTEEPMPYRYPEGQHYPYGYGNSIFNNNQEYALEDPRRIRMIKYEPASVPVHVKAYDQKVEENVDAEAEQFIRMEHKKFQLSKLKSELSGK